MRLDALLFIIFIFLLIPSVQGEILIEDWEDGTFNSWSNNYVPVIDSNYSYNSNYGARFYAHSTADPPTQSSSYWISTETYNIINHDMTGHDGLGFWVKELQIGDDAGGWGGYFKVSVTGGPSWTFNYLDTPSGVWEYHELDVSALSGDHEIKIEHKAVWGDTEVYFDEMFFTTSTLSGYVKNNYGNTVSSANINLNASGGSTTSNDTGYYEITGLESGTYSITATSPTHQDYSSTVSITADTEKNITMTRLSPVLTWTDAETTENDVFLKWRRNIVVDNVRIYKDTETRLLTTVASGSYLSGLYSDRNLDCDKGYVYWLQPMDNDVAGPKYRIDAKTDPCDGGGGGGGDPTPTPSPTATPGPTPPPWTNITPEEWLNLTLDQKQEILANMSLFPPLLEFQWEDIYVWGIHLFLILCGAVALDSITIQKVSEYTGLWAILPGVMFAYLTGYLVI